ncbi:hypothetical protein HPP92_028288 [Vanilla planifolia]|uniref:Uncharacterized protein n=1 Tax=Vanilla planifolia TaxID=51239 RepID=A0A835P697_VANPL|nr:hypothetical protein HPP92_028288 [Vanilla planifolia]KAG0447591.1 hypothetical protein HPP92_028270 [Vanilla planifolia]
MEVVREDYSGWAEKRGTEKRRFCMENLGCGRSQEVLGQGGNEKLCTLEVLRQEARSSEAAWRVKPPKWRRKRRRRTVTASMLEFIAVGKR